MKLSIFQIIFLSLIILIISKINWVDFDYKTNSAMYISTRTSKAQMIAISNFF